MLASLRRTITDATTVLVCLTGALRCAQPATQLGPGPITDPELVLVVPDIVKPPYRLPIAPPPFGLSVVRITGDSGELITVGDGQGAWGREARHHYSKDQPWSADGRLIALQNRRGGSSRQVYLDGETYEPRLLRCPNYPYNDDRWHPSKAHASVRINVRDRQLIWFDVRACEMKREWTLPFAVTGIGQDEGNPSFDGRFVALTDGERAFVVDMDPKPPLAPYPARRIGPAVDLRDCGLPGGCPIGWISVSASGRYVVVSHRSARLRVYDIDSETLALTPRTMPSGAPRCTGTAGNGFIYDLGHADLTLNPFDDHEDVIVGQEHCRYRGEMVDGKLMGGVVMVRLRDGAVTPLTDPSNESYPHHVSTRNYERLGWAYVGYYSAEGKRFSDEIVAVKLDGSKSVERYAHKHSESSGCYRCEPHAAPSPDGSRVLWASNWMLNGNGTGSPDAIQAYIVHTTPR